MSALSDVRLNPRTNAVSWRAMDPEIHTIAEFDFCPGQYGFQLQDSVQPSTLTLTENITGGAEFELVTTAPLAGQCYVNYSNGICVFNVADNGTEVISNAYNGGGSNANIANLSVLSTFAGKTTDDLTEGVTNLYYPAADETKLAGIAAGADVTATQVVTASVVNSLIPVLHPHGVFNTKFTAVNNGTTEQSLGIDLSVATFNILCAVRKAGSTGDVEWLASASAIKITMPTGTWSAQIAGITITGAYDFYKYIVSDNGTIRTMISRSPYHKSVPANYYHTISATGMTAVGSPSTAWDAAFLSGSGAINATNACVCLGLIGTITINGTTGLASAATLATGALPSWNRTNEPKLYITTQATPTRVTGAAPDVLGEYRSYLRNSSARTYTETNGSPTTAPSSANGYLLYANAAWASGDSSNQPSRYELFIGTNKEPIFEFYKNTGRTGKIFPDMFYAWAGVNYDGGSVYGYDPMSGVAWVTKAYPSGGTASAGMDETTTPITANIYFDILC